MGRLGSILSSFSVSLSERLGDSRYLAGFASVLIALFSFMIFAVSILGIVTFGFGLFAYLLYLTSGCNHFRRE